MSQSENMVAMPQYQCHKKVWALKIASVDRVDDINGLRINFEDSAFGPMDFTEGSLKKRPMPEPGWYMVQYDDGYISFSPAKAFEEGYTLIPSGPKAHQDRVIAERQELNEKIVKLGAFLQSSIFKTLPVDEQERLSHQLWHMKDYENILVQRIANFK